MRFRKSILAGMVAPLCIGTAAAAEDSGSYVGALAGSTEFRFDSEFTWGLFAGWKFSRHFAAELGYYKPDSSSYEGTGAGSIPYDVQVSRHTIATTFIGSYPFNDTWSVFARLGVAFPKVKTSGVIDGDDYAASESSSELIYGGGVGMKLKRAQLRFEYQLMHFGSQSNGGLLSLDVVIPIGN